LGIALDFFWLLSSHLVRLCQRTLLRQSPEATAYELSTADQARRLTFTERASHALSAGCRVREWRGRLCAPRGVLGLGIVARAGTRTGLWWAAGIMNTSNSVWSAAWQNQSKERFGSPSHSLLAVYCAAWQQS